MIEVRNLHKAFKMYAKPSDRLKELVLRRDYHSNFQALKHINFKVNKGETLGILGKNGAGKSTLLKILNGVLMPDRGEVITSGTVTGLLELGTGFDPSLSGFQNIRTNGLLLGMTDAQITERTPAIIAFAELGKFIDEPLRTYSSGMTMRLAFAIAIHADPETFLIDEALSVGDGQFQQKCMQRIRDFKNGGGSIVFVSHDLNAVKMICDRTLVMNRGEIVYQGPPEAAVNYYNQLLTGETDRDKLLSASTGGYGNYHAKIVDAALVGADSTGDILTSGEEALLDVDIEGQRELDDLTLGLLIRDRFGQDVFGTNSHYYQLPLTISPGEHYRVRFTFPMNLRPGKYTVSLALHKGPTHTGDCYHWWDNACQFVVSGVRGPRFTGVCNLQPLIEKLPAPGPRADNH